jgi:tetratricopeptide (TPR) repeat protein
MKKITILLLFPICFHWGVSHAEIQCAPLKQQYEDVKYQAEQALNIWRSLDSNAPNKTSQSNAVSALLADGVRIEKEYNDCLENVVNENKLKTLYFGLGNEEFSKEAWDNAIQKYTKVVQIDPNSYQANYNIASAYANK